MKQVKNKGLKILLLGLCTQLAYYSLFAQADAINTIANQFDQYRVNALQEKLFVHTDKNFYVPGEIIWFKLYDVDGHFNKPLDISKVSYVEILSDDHKPVLQAKISMKDGNGSGSFLVPYSINSGNYVLRAYTNWMKNFLPEFYFEKIITIINPLKKPDWPDEGHNSAAYDIQFFPEGGNMVNGIESKIAFRVADKYGRGVDCNGAVINQKNDTVARFQSLKFGLGNFLMTPAKGDTYTAIINAEKDKLIRHELPAIYDNGYVMSLSEPDKDHLLITVISNASQGNPFVYLFGQTRHLIKVALAKELSEGKTTFLLDKKTLGEGVSQFTVFNERRQPVCERLYFRRPEQNLVLDINPDKQNYSRREKVALMLNAHDNANKAEIANLSMSVVLLDSIQSIDQNDIATYFWLTSDLKGKIESPDYYLKNTGHEVDEAIDNLMLTHGWRRFRWEDVLANKKPSFEFVPEYEGHIVNGKVVDKRSGLPVENIITYLSVPGARYQLNISTSNQKGQIHFDVKNFYGSNEMVAETNSAADSLYRIEIASPFIDKFSSDVMPPFSFSEKWINQLISRSNNAQVQNSFVTNKRQQFLLPAIDDSTAFYGTPDKKYFLDDYTRFVTMEEVMREYVEEVRVRKQKDKFRFDVWNKPYGDFFENKPLVLFDGIPVFDVDKIIAFDPLKVKKLEVVARKYTLDSVVQTGILSYTTYQGDLAGFQLDPNALVLEYPGLQLQREFYSPVYETAAQQESRTPDFRDLLFWSPSVKTNEEGKKQVDFYTSDLPGEYIIFVQGITADGIAGSAVSRFSVRK